MYSLPVLFKTLWYFQQRYCAMPTSFGALEPPLGNARLQVVKLITALVANNMASVNMELVNLNTLQALIVSRT